MKKLSIIIGLLLFTAISMNINAQSSQETLSQILELSKAKKFSEAAALIAYDGPNESKKLQAAYNPNDENELNSVKRICKKIKALIDISDSYEIGNPNETKEDGVDWTVIEVSFKSGNQNLKTIFSFVKVDDKFLLGDID